MNDLRLDGYYTNDGGNENERVELRDIKFKRYIFLAKLDGTARGGIVIAIKDMLDIPVKFVGPGSQPLVGDDPQLSFIAMPTEMSRYFAPDIPEPEQVEHLQGARAVTHWLS